MGSKSASLVDSSAKTTGAGDITTFGNKAKVGNTTIKLGGVGSSITTTDHGAIGAAFGSINNVMAKALTAIDGANARASTLAASNAAQANTVAGLGASAAGFFQKHGTWAIVGAVLIVVAIAAAIAWSRKK